MSAIDDFSEACAALDREVRAKMAGDFARNLSCDKVPPCGAFTAKYDEAIRILAEKRGEAELLYTILERGVKGIYEDDALRDPDDAEPQLAGCFSGTGADEAGNGTDDQGQDEGGRP